MKRHLKRHHAPKTWPILRKEAVFITRPYPSGHGFALSVPLSVVLRDMLGICQTAAEGKRLMQHEEVLIDGKPQKDVKANLGLFDVLSFPKDGTSRRLSLDDQGRLALVDIPNSEDKCKPCRIVKKTLVKGKMQLGLHDGRTLFHDGPCKVGDSLIVEIPSGKPVKRLELKENASIFLIKGKYKGVIGTLKSRESGKIVFTDGKRTLETHHDYALVVGEEKPEVKIK